MNDRLALRVGALRLARLRGNARVAAWAAARLRLRDASLDAGDARYAHDAMVAFGHALRVERARRPHESGHEVDRILDENRPGKPLPWRRIGMATAAVLALALLLVWRAPARPSGAAAGATAAPEAVALATASPLRGRSDLVIAVVVTPAPPRASQPATTITGPEPVDAEDRRGTGGSGGTSGGGTGSGGSGGTSGGGTGTAPPQPAPTPTAAPTIMVLDISVIDARTHLGIQGVCVSDGLTTCANAPLTDALGHTQLRLSIGQQWHLEFKRDGYFTMDQFVFSDAASKSIQQMLTATR